MIKNIVNQYNLINHYMQKYLQDPEYKICANDTNHSWCNFEVVDNNSMIVEVGYLTFAVLFLFFTLCNYSKLKSYERNFRYRQYFGQGFYIMHRIFFMWILSIFIRTIANIYAYHKIMLPKKDITEKNDPPILQPIVILSCICLFLRFYSAFLINSIICIYPYQWIKAVIICVNEVYLVGYKEKRLLKSWMKVLNVFRLYCFLRTLFIPFILSQPILFYVTQWKCSIRFYDSYIMSSQSLLVIMFYFFCFYILRYIRKNSLLKYQLRQSIKLNCWFFLMFILFIVRIATNFYFQFVFQSDNKFNSYCLLINQSNESFWNQMTILLIVKHSITHIVPFFITLLIYRPKIVEVEITSQIIIERQRHKQIQIQFYRLSLTQKPKLNQSRIQPLYL